MGFILRTLVFFSVFCIIVKSQESVPLRVDQTEVKGVVEGRRGQREYYAFKGIQYAAANRWQDPVLLEIIEQEYDATKFGAVCPQYGRDESSGKRVYVGNEECLFLNVYTRVIPSSSSSGPTTGNENLNPVMVYIHGGGFNSGSGEIAGPRHFMTANEKVVLVTINYRLGVLGFLSTGDSELPGNLGMLDQVKALDWVQKYIQYFGGDPNRVTIFGHSAGGASVHLLTLSPLATGKFHGAILTSGNALCQANIQPNPLSYARKVATAVSCPTGIESKAEMINCLRNQSGATLVKTQESLVDFWIYPKHAVPVVDGQSRGSDAFLPQSPSDLIEAGKFEPVPMITGVTLNEGFYGYAKIHNIFSNTQFRNTTYFKEELLPRVLKGLLRIENETDEVQPLNELVLENYFHGLNMTDETSFKAAITELSELIGDILYYSCQRDFLERYAYKARAPVFSYVFTHETITSPRISAGDIEALRKQNIYHHLFNFAVPHLEDMYYLFDPVGIATERRLPALSTADEHVAASYVKCFIAFAKSGSPAGALDPTKEIWRPIKQGTLNYFNVTSIPALMGEDFRKRESLFWLRTVPYFNIMGANLTAMEEKLQETEDALSIFKILFWVAITLAILLLISVFALGLVLWRKRTTGKASLH